MFCFDNFQRVRKRQLSFHAYCVTRMRKIWFWFDKCIAEINEKLLKFVGRDYCKCLIVWSSIKRDIVCCGLVSSPYSRRINLVWSTHECHTICPLSVTPKQERTLFQRTNNTFGIFLEMKIFSSSANRIYSVKKPLQSHHKETALKLHYVWLLLLNCTRKEYSVKGTQSKMKFTLWHSLLNERRKNYFCSIICQNRRFHISNTHFHYALYIEQTKDGCLIYFVFEIILFFSVLWLFMLMIRNEFFALTTWYQSCFGSSERAGNPGMWW